MGGKRRKPYAFRITKGFDINGKQRYEYLGYFSTRKEAMDFQIKFSYMPKETTLSLTFKEVYEMWYRYHSKDISTISAKAYEGSFSKCDVIKDKPINNVPQNVLQSLIDNENTTGGARGLYLLFKMVFDYAEKNSYIMPQNNRTKYLDVPKQQKSNSRYRFSNEELETLWEHKDDEVVQTILILIYTGVRPMEYFNLTQDNVKGNYFIVEKGKTENAKREVPLHKDILPFFKLCDGIDTQGKYSYWVTHKFEPKMEELGILYHEDKKATPYCCRHTFNSMFFEIPNFNETYRRFIVGHSREGVGEQIYAHIDVMELKKEVDKLPTKFS